MRRFAPVVLICATAVGAPAALQISSTAAPAGGFAQIAIYAVKPIAISNGHLVLSLDATAFGAGAVIGLFGANGDASGLEPQQECRSMCSFPRHRVESASLRACR